MKILIVHNRYREPGGEDECARSEAELLEEHGHQVVWYTLDNATLRPGVGSALESLWNRRSYAELRALIRREQPNVAHFHNTFHLVSPAGYWAAHAEGVPVVQTLHNYRLLCCNALLLREGRPCEDCVGRRIAWQGVVRACYRGSVGASLGVTATTALHRALGTWRDRVDVYVTPSQFLSSKFIAAGFSPHRIVVKPNFVHPDPGAGRGEGGFVLFVGRLSPEKGVGTLLRAWSMVGTAIQLRIVGDGPLARDVVKASRSVRIEWLGRKPSDEVLELMGQARFVVIPSEWYENFPLVLVEAWSKATPIIASNVGATADLVTDRVTGFHFRAGDAEDLARVVRSACAEGRDGSAMRRRVREHYESHYSGEANYRMLTRIYTKALTDRARENRALEAFGRPSETRR